MTHFQAPIQAPIQAARAKSGRLAPLSLRQASQRPAPPPRAIAIAACIALVLVVLLGDDGQTAERPKLPPVGPSLHSLF